MFEVFYIPTGEVMYMTSTYDLALKQVIRKHDCNDYDIRLCEDRWPEYESVMEMEKWQ